jgi:hypothetical protein
MGNDNLIFAKILLNPVDPNIPGSVPQYITF